MSVMKKSILLSSVFIVLSLVLSFSLNQAYAVEPGEEVSLTGTFSIVWGDSQDGKSSMVYTLTQGGIRTILQLDKVILKELGGILSFNGKNVTVNGFMIAPIIFSPLKSASSIEVLPTQPAVMNVTSMSLAPLLRSLAPEVLDVQVLAAVSGSHPWVTIMCKFSDISDEPNDITYFQDMYGDTKPGLNHYWKELSYNNVNIAGSSVGTGWYDLPGDELIYNPTDTEQGTDRNLLAQDCLDAADPSVDFSLYSGINMMFNSNFDNGWAWGGTRTMTRDGETKTWSITWEPPWAYHQVSVIAHEMGHGLGLPHSSYDRSAVYDSWWDVMSKDRYNCAAATDPTYGCMAQHTISYHKDKLGWILGTQIITVAPGSHATLILEDLAAPASSNYHMVKIPIGGSTTNFYTVEARKFTGYDVKLPEEAVVIHNVDTTEGIPAVLVPDVGGVADAWVSGEAFVDALNNIVVMVKSDTGTGFEVSVSNGNLPPESDANGPYNEECMGAVTSVMMDATGSYDPEGGELTYSWETTCDGTFDNATLDQPTLRINTSNVCSYSCSVAVTATDAEGLEGFGDTSIVTIGDTTPPVLIGVPGDETVECDALPTPAPVSATDICDSDVTPIFAEERTDGICVDSYTLTWDWDGTDGCGNSSFAKQVITVQDTVEPVIACNSSVAISPNNAPVSFTASATDNCAEELFVELIGYDCFKTTKKGKLIDKKESCVVELSDDTVNIVDSGGVGDTITWVARTSDNCGNVTETTCSIVIVNPAQP